MIVIFLQAKEYTLRDYIALCFILRMSFSERAIIIFMYNQTLVSNICRSRIIRTARQPFNVKPFLLRCQKIPTWLILHHDCRLSTACRHSEVCVVAGWRGRGGGRLLLSRPAG